MQVDTGMGTAVTESVPNVLSLGGIIKIPLPGFCLTCFPFPLVNAFPSRPASISNNTGDVTVTVTRSRAGGSIFRFWVMSYPGQILSQSVGHYKSASVSLWPSSSAVAEINSVR